MTRSGKNLNQSALIGERHFRFSSLYLAQAGVKSKLFEDVGKLFGGTKESPAGARELGPLITSIVQILLLVAASIAVIFLIVGGYQYVTAHGNEEKSEAAKKTMKASIWGLVIIVLSFAIISIIANILLKGAPGTGI